MSESPRERALRLAAEFHEIIAAADVEAVEPLIDAVPEPALLVDITTGAARVIAANAALRRALPAAGDGSGASELDELLEPRSLLALDDACRRFTHPGGPGGPELEIRLRRSWWRAALMPATGPFGKITRIVALLSRADRDRRIREAFEENRRRLDLALRGAQAGIVEIDVVDGGAGFDENAAAMLTGRYQELALSAAGWMEHVHPDYRERLTRTIAACASGEALSLRVEHRVLRRDGAVGWVELIGKVQDHDEDGRPSRLLGIQLDITERKEAEAKIRRLAQNDPVTDLPNRSTFLRWLSAACAMADRRKSRVAVMLIDLHGFKEINDGFGHLVGDEVLRVTGERLQFLFGRKRAVARFGADEFSVLLADLDDDAAAFRAAQAAVAALSKPVDALGVQVDCAICVGFSIFPAPSGDEDAMLADADAALVFGKSEGPGTVRAFEPAIAAFRKADIRLAAELREALDEGRLELHYQPIVSHGPDALYGFEALLRWRNRAGEPVRPDITVQMAERRGLIGPLTDWVIRTACVQTARWAEVRDGLSMSINVPPRILRSDDFVARAGEIMAETRVDPACVVFEITEEALADARRIVPTLEGLRGLGVRIAVDDFGAGYSSMSRLRNLPVDILKIDRSFVVNLPADPVDVAIVDSILRLGATLGLTVVGEGIERADQLELLTALGCRHIQGYIHAPALPAQEAGRWLRGAPRSPGSVFDT